MDELVGWGMLAVAATSAAIGELRRAAERRRARRELRTRPVLAPSTADGAVVRVTGIVRAIEPLTAPLSGRECVIYRSRVDATTWMFRREARRGRHEATRMAPFVIDRGAEGTVLVDGTHALLDLPALKLGDGDRARREQFLMMHGVPIREATRARFEETIVEPGMTVSVAGLIMLDVATEPSVVERHFREAPPPALRLTGNAEHPLAIGAEAMAA
jgi:hypothetical protein